MPSIILTCARDRRRRRRRQVSATAGHAPGRSPKRRSKPRVPAPRSCTSMSAIPRRARRAWNSPTTARVVDAHPRIGGRRRHQPEHRAGGALRAPSWAPPTAWPPARTCGRRPSACAHIVALRPEICSLDMGSLNFGSGVLVNTPAQIRTIAEGIREAGSKPELRGLRHGAHRARQQDARRRPDRSAAVLSRWRSACRGARRRRPRRWPS